MREKKLFHSRFIITTKKVRRDFSPGYNAKLAR